MIRYYLCPIIGTGQGEDIRDPNDESIILTPEDSFRPSLADIPGVNWVTDTPNRSENNGKPNFKYTVVYATASAAVHAQIMALPGVIDLLEGFTDDTNSKTEVIRKLQNSSFSGLSTAMKAKLRAKIGRVATRFDNSSVLQAGSVEDDSIESWLDSVMQQQNLTARIRNLYVGD